MRLSSTFCVCVVYFCNFVEKIAPRLTRLPSVPPAATKRSLQNPPAAKHQQIASESVANRRESDCFSSKSESKPASSTFQTHSGDQHKKTTPLICTRNAPAFPCMHTHATEIKSIAGEDAQQQLHKSRIVNQHTLHSEQVVVLFSATAQSITVCNRVLSIMMMMPPRSTHSHPKTHARYAIRWFKSISTNRAFN